MPDALSDADEVLLRQIHPNFLQHGEPSSDRFCPSENDEGLLSVDRSSLTTASAAHALYTSTGKASAAVFGVSVGEFRTEAIPCFPDPLTATDDHPANAAHALADFTAHPDKKRKLVAKKLKRAAIARGQLHP